MSGGLVSRHLLPLQLHRLLDEVRRRRLVVPQELVEHLQNRLRYLPLGGEREKEDSERAVVSLGQDAHFPSSQEREKK